MLASEFFRFFFQGCEYVCGKKGYEPEIRISQFQFFFGVTVRSMNEKEKCEDGGLLSDEKKGFWWKMKVFFVDVAVVVVSNEKNENLTL